MKEIVLIQGEPEFDNLYRIGPIKKRQHTVNDLN